MRPSNCLEVAPDYLFALSVERRGRFIEDSNARISYERAIAGDALPLAARKSDAET